MKKCDFPDKKLRRGLLASEIFLSLVCISPVLGIVIEHHSAVQLLKCVVLTAVMTAIIVLSWAFYFQLNKGASPTETEKQDTD